MTIQEAITIICEVNGWTFEGSYMLQHPFTPANCGGGGGHRERRYEFCLKGCTETANFNTRGVKARARVALAVREGCKQAIGMFC